MSTPKEFLLAAQEAANEVDHENHDEAIIVAFDAVYSDIVAQAKAEALLSFAEDTMTALENRERPLPRLQFDQAIRTVIDLRNRAATIEGKDS